MSLAPAELSQRKENFREKEHFEQRLRQKSRKLSSKNNIYDLTGRFM